MVTDLNSRGTYISSWIESSRVGSRASFLFASFFFSFILLTFQNRPAPFPGRMSYRRRLNLVSSLLYLRER